MRMGTMLSSSSPSCSFVQRSTSSQSSPPPSIHSTPTSPVRNNGNNNGNNALECDYDVNPTYLYQAIEARQWKHAADFLSRDERAHVQAATWVIRKETNGKLRWRLLPLHAAIIFGSPLDVMELLLGEHPAAAQCKDDQGMLPLHLGFRNFVSWDILEELITAYPQAISVKDRKGRTPLQCASSSFRKPASVLELYSHVAITTERVALTKKNKNELQAQIGALQESHVHVLEGLRGDWQHRLQTLERQLLDVKSRHDELQVLYDQSQQELANKVELERELTTKLTLVTDALTTSENNNNAAGLLQSPPPPPPLQAEIGTTLLRRALRASESANAEWQAENQTLRSENVQLRAIVQELLNESNNVQQRLHQCAVQQDGVVRERRGRLEALLQDFVEWTSIAAKDDDDDGLFVNEVEREWQESNQRAADLFSQLVLLDDGSDATLNGGGGDGGDEEEVRVVLEDGEQDGNVGDGPSDEEVVPDQEPDDMTLTPLQEEEESVVTSTSMPTPTVPEGAQKSSAVLLHVGGPLPDPPTFPTESTTTMSSLTTKDSDDAQVASNGGIPSDSYIRGIH